MMVDNFRHISTSTKHKNSELYSSGTVKYFGITVTSEPTINTSTVKSKYGAIGFRKGKRPDNSDKIPTMDTLQFITTVTDSLMSLTIIRTQVTATQRSPGYHPHIKTYDHEGHGDFQFHIE
jgi:hypothetical protein